MTSKIEIINYREILHSIIGRGSVNSTDLLSLEDVLYMLDELNTCHTILDEAGIDDSAICFDEPGTRNLQDRIQSLANRFYSLSNQVNRPAYQTRMFK